MCMCICSKLIVYVCVFVCVCVCVCRVPVWVSVSCLVPVCVCVCDLSCNVCVCGSICSNTRFSNENHSKWKYILEESERSLGSHYPARIPRYSDPRQPYQEDNFSCLHYHCTEEYKNTSASTRPATASLPFPKGYEPFFFKVLTTNLSLKRCESANILHWISTCSNHD